MVEECARLVLRKVVISVLRDEVCALYARGRICVTQAAAWAPSVRIAEDDRLRRDWAICGSGVGSDSRSSRHLQRERISLGELEGPVLLVVRFGVRVDPQEVIDRRHE